MCICLPSLRPIAGCVNVQRIDSLHWSKTRCSIGMGSGVQFSEQWYGTKEGMAMFVGPQDVLDMRSMNII